MPKDDENDGRNDGDAVFLSWLGEREVGMLVASGSHLYCVVREERGRKMRARGLLPMYLRLHQLIARLH